ncbi:LysR family transcriptional regulator substrate-binding protein [Curtobacterium sp. 9128]|uniref:LysR family transcriptional regulator substrate-binding protein n=1 Tax=Curtobacterium sp. 9128 TaxID=1793722 RepID=UPI001642DC69|nr:LysR family transcriptional regulator substrate-binding protein [Curtobacterium sp. 9128]
MTAALTIAFVPGVSPAKWARVWRERFPTVELVLRPIGSPDVDAALAEDVDMVFARMPVTEAHNAIPLWTETAVVATPKDSTLADATEITLADLADVHVIDAGPVPADVDGTLDLVETGIGVAVLPQSLFRKASRKDLVARTLVDSPGTRIALVWRDEDASDLTAEFIGVVRGRTANSSRSQPDQPGGPDRAGDDDARPPRGGSKAAAAGKAAVGGKAKAKSPGGAKSGSGKGSNSGKAPKPGRGRMRGKPSRGSKGNR